MCADLPGVDGVLDAGGKVRHGLDHEGVGELVLVAERGAWFTYLLCSDPAADRDSFATPEVGALMLQLDGVGERGERPST